MKAKFLDKNNFPIVIFIHDTVNRCNQDPGLIIFNWTIKKNHENFYLEGGGAYSLIKYDNTLVLVATV
jgi:hypothetical protein